MKRAIGMVVALGLCFAAAAIGGLATQRAPDFYATLSRPSWAPPSWLFGPVWSALYTLMAVAAWLVWKEDGFAAARGALWLFGVQLAFNALWSWLFFGCQLGTLARIEIVLLLVLIALTIVAFWRVRPLAGVLLVPYLLWVVFATALTFSIVQRNPGTF